MVHKKLEDFRNRNVEATCRKDGKSRKAIALLSMYIGLGLDGN